MFLRKKERFKQIFVKLQFYGNTLILLNLNVLRLLMLSYNKQSFAARVDTQCNYAINYQSNFTKINSHLTYFHL